MMVEVLHGRILSFGVRDQGAGLGDQDSAQEQTLNPKP